MDGNPQVMPILDSVIRNAIKNGWYFEFDPISGKELPSTEKAESFTIKNLVLTVIFTNGSGRIFPCVDMVIFDHYFAKAFWGDKRTCNHGVDISDSLNAKCSCAWEGGISSKAWQYHLQEMVLEENPIQYLAKFL